MPDATFPLNELTRYMPDQNICWDALAAAEKDLFQKCKIQLFRLAKHLKKMHPSAQEWKSQFRVFICGGGSAIQFYKNLVSEFSDWLQQNYDNHGAMLMLFPRQEKIHGNIPEGDYHRFGVAVGLSHYSTDFDRVMKNIKPIIEDENSASSEPWFLKMENAYLVDY